MLNATLVSHFSYLSLLFEGKQTYQKFIPYKGYSFADKTHKISDFSDIF